MKLLRNNKNALIPYCEKFGLGFWYRDDFDASLSLEGCIDRAEILEDEQWYPCELYGAFASFPIVGSTQIGCVVDFVALMPFYLAIVDWFCDRKVRLSEYLEQFDEGIQRNLLHEPPKRPDIGTVNTLGATDGETHPDPGQANATPTEITQEPGALPPKPQHPNPA